MKIVGLRYETQVVANVVWTWRTDDDRPASLRIQVGRLPQVMVGQRGAPTHDLWWRDDMSKKTIAFIGQPTGFQAPFLVGDLEDWFKNPARVEEYVSLIELPKALP